MLGFLLKLVWEPCLRKLKNKLTLTGRVNICPPFYFKMEEKVFIYSLTDPITNEIRYIGKANDLKERLTGHYYPYGNTYKDNWIKKLKKEGLKPIIEELDYVIKSEWKFWEKYWISQFKTWGFRLTNLTDGGEGVDGLKHSKETKEKLSKMFAGKRMSPETEFKKGMKTWNSGTKGLTKANDKSFKKGQVSLRKGVTITKEQKEKMKFFEKGSIPWNKGLSYTRPKKYDEDYAKELVIKIINNEISVKEASKLLLVSRRYMNTLKTNHINLN